MKRNYNKPIMKTCVTKMDAALLSNLSNIPLNPSPNPADSRRIIRNYEVEADDSWETF